MKERNQHAMRETHAENHKQRQHKHRQKKKTIKPRHKQITHTTKIHTPAG